MNRAILLCLTLFACSVTLFGQLKINSTRHMGFGADPQYDRQFYFLNSSEDRGLVLLTTKNSGGWMRGFVNEIRSTRHSALMLAFTNDVDKHSGDTKALYGFANYMRHRGSGRNIGIQNVVYREGTGEKRGLYNNVQDSDASTAGSTNHIFGVYNYLHAMYRPRAYGSYNLLVNDNANSADQVYGVYVEETGTGSAATYGIYSKVDNRPGSYAAYFEGPTHINGTYNQASDKKFKKDINKLISALDIINALKPKSYRFNELAGSAFDQEKLHYGFLAQELEEVLPDLVSEVTRPASYRYDDEHLVNGDTTAAPREAELYSDATTYKAVRYNDLIAILAQALQEEDLKIKNHDKNLKEEKDKNNRLQEQVTQLQLLVNDLSTRLQLLETCTDCGTPKKSGFIPQSSLKNSTTIVPLWEAGYTVYPNPTSDQLTVEGPAAEGMRLHLYDSQGRRVLDLPYENGRSQLSIRNLPSGSYHLSVFQESQQQSVGRETIILR